MRSGISSLKQRVTPLRPNKDRQVCFACLCDHVPGAVTDAIPDSYESLSSAVDHGRIADKASPPAKGPVCWYLRYETGPRLHKHAGIDTRSTSADHFSDVEAAFDNRVEDTTDVFYSAATGYDDDHLVDGWQGLVRVVVGLKSANELLVTVE